MVFLPTVTLALSEGSVLYTGTQTAPCTLRMASGVILIVHLEVDSGFEEPQFPHLCSLSFTITVSGLALFCWQHRRLHLPSTSRLWPAWEYHDYSCVCVCFSPGPALGTFHPSCSSADICFYLWNETSSRTALSKRQRKEAFLATQLVLPAGLGLGILRSTA